ncbi:MAG: lamin tail domain-containing protein [Parcubacteria group bacterium]
MFLFLSVLIAIVFCFWKNSSADETLKITAIQYSGGTGKTDEDFIEITNNSTADIDLNGYRLVKRSATASKDTNIKSWTSAVIVPAGQKHLWANSQDGFAEKIKANSSTTETISEGNQIAIRLGKVDEGTIINSINWKENDEEENPDDEPEEENYSGKLKINEIFPAPKTKNEGKEFVEIINTSDEKIDLAGMRIEDEKNHKVNFPEKTIAPLELFILEGNFELNNTSSDTAFLIAKDNTKENPIDAVSYEKPKYDYAYAFDGIAWQWTKLYTPGTENKFEKLLSGKIKKDSKIYANVYANFEVKADSAAQKFTWNFGDGHKSYLKKTRHKYKKTGTYEASLKITGDGRENLLNFTVKVEKFGKTKVQIISLSPNPQGKDSVGEWLEILNGTKKKVNLKNWSIATGWEKLYNHPIAKDFILKAGETKMLTRKFSAFSLGNKQAKIELRYPDGKVADKLKYDHKNKSISEDELYQKTGKSWQWILSPKDTEPARNATHSVAGGERTNYTKNKPVAIAPEVKIEEPLKADFDLSDLGKSTKNPSWHKKQENQITLLFAGSNISPVKLLAQNQGQVLGISTIKLVPNISHKEATALNFFDQLWKKINAKLNEFILLF